MYGLQQSTRFLNSILMYCVGWGWVLSLGKTCSMIQKLTQVQDNHRLVAVIEVYPLVRYLPEFVHDLGNVDRGRQTHSI